MDWSKLTPQEFVENISLIGLAAAQEIARRYDSLPWNLRVLWWATHRPSSVIEWISLVASPGTYDPDVGFWGQLNNRALREHYQNYTREQSIEARSFAWFDDLRENSRQNTQSIVLTKILSGKITNIAAENPFQDFDKTHPLKALFDITQDTHESVWEDLWEKHNTSTIIGHPCVPVACIDRWRSANYPDHEKDLIFVTAVRRRTSLPEHWVQEILSGDPLEFNASALGAYLSREDVPIDIRKVTENTATSTSKEPPGPMANIQTPN